MNNYHSFLLGLITGLSIQSCIKKEKKLYYDYKVPPVHDRLKLYFG